MTITAARNICCLALGSLLLIAVVAGAFVGLSTFALSLMAFLSMVLLGKKSALNSAIGIVRELRFLGGDLSEQKSKRNLGRDSKLSNADKSASVGASATSAKRVFEKRQEAAIVDGSTDMSSIEPTPFQPQ